MAGPDFNVSCLCSAAHTNPPERRFPLLAPLDGASAAVLLLLALLTLPAPVMTAVPA